MYQVSGERLGRDFKDVIGEEKGGGGLRESDTIDLLMLSNYQCKIYYPSFLFKIVIK